MQLPDLPFHDWLGFAAAFLTTVSFIPQAVQTLRTQNVSGISLAMYALFVAGVALWLVYGLWIGSMPVAVANAFTLLFAGAVLWAKLKYGRSQ